MASRVWAGVLLAMGAAACGQAFSAGTGGSASSSSSSSSGTGGHTSSSASSSSSTGVSSSSSGAAGCGACMANEYCNSTQNKCTMCSDLSRFQFASPVKLTVPLPGLGAARFPRMDAEGTLYFTYQATQGTQLASASLDKYPTWNAATVMATPPNPSGPAAILGPLPVESATLLSSWGAPSGSLLLFDAPGMGATNERVILAFQLGQTAQPPVPLMLPGMPSTAERMAVATTPQRYFWLSTSLTTYAATDPSPATVGVNLDNGAAGFPNQPWVTPDGTLLLFTSMPTGDAVQHLYFVRLNTYGQVTPSNANAQRVFPGTIDEDSDPSLTPNACALLFSRLGSLYGAVRN